MELNFIKDGNVFIAEFEVAGDFNLHVERKERGIFSVYQRTALNGKYAYVEDIGSQTGKDVIEYDFTGVIYPKMIKIVSEVNPTIAEVTSIGEVTEIKSQTKEIEVTANGTTEVTPDAGFSYLNSVTIKTNVPQSGEGGGSASDVYVNFDVPEDVTPGGLIGELIASIPIIEVAYKNKYLGYSLAQGQTAIIQYFQDPLIFDDITEVIGFHFSGQIMTPDGLVNVLDYLLSIIPLPAKPITKAEFYNLEGGE